MIFVTVGTHEQQFNRLVQKVDELKSNGTVKDKVFIQTGFSDYVPQYCEWKKFLSYKEMQQYFNEAKIIITHGGPSSFIPALQLGKIPIVVPRRKEFGEHINNHQVAFADAVMKKYNNIIVVNNIDELISKIVGYDHLIQSLNEHIINNNAMFCAKFEEISLQLLKKY